MTTALLLALTLAQAGALQPDVRCLEDATQGYALYLPKFYVATRDWPVLLVFDPRA